MARPTLKELINGEPKEEYAAEYLQKIMITLLNIQQMLEEAANAKGIAFRHQKKS